MIATARRVSEAVAGSEATAEADRRQRFTRYVLPELPVLLRVALSLTDQLADAEDLVQDTVLRAYRSLDTFDGAHPRAWLLTILRNANINRHRRRRPQLLDDPDVELERLAGMADPAGSPETLVVGETFDAVVGGALAELPDRFAQVVRLVDIAGLSYADVADLLGVPVGTVMSRLHRARARIRARLTAAGLAPKKGLR